MKLQQLQEVKYALTRKRLSDFQVGDKIIIVTKSLRGIEKRVAEVRLINHNNLQGITYGPTYHKDYLHSGQGHFDPKEIGKHPYGIVDVKMFYRRPRPGIATHDQDRV